VIENVCFVTFNLNQKKEYSWQDPHYWWVCTCNGHCLWDILLEVFDFRKHTR